MRVRKCPRKTFPNELAKSRDRSEDASVTVHQVDSDRDRTGPEEWNLGSEATSHMTGTRQLVKDYKETAVGVPKGEASIVTLLMISLSKPNMGATNL
jgi:hypothetical protein